MRRRLRTQDVIYGKTKRDTEFSKELEVKQEFKGNTQVDVNKYANNPRPKYEIFPGE